MHITDTQNPQVHFGVFQSLVFMKVMSTASDIKETPKLDLGISGVCYMYTMLIYLCNYYLEYMYISFKNTLEITGEEPRLGFGLLLPDVLVVFVYSSKPETKKNREIT